MNCLRGFLVVLAVASVAVFSSSVSAIELTTNGGFETGDLTGWTQFETAAGQQTVTTVNPSSGTYAGSIDNSVAASNSLWKQANLAAGLLVPGQAVTISFDARGSFTPGGVAFAEFFSEIDGGGVSAGGILGGGPLAVDADPDVWKTFTFPGILTGPDVSGGVTLQLGATNGASTSPNAHMWYDNVSVSVDSLIPEPTSFTLLGLAAGLSLVGRRRK